MKDYLDRFFPYLEFLGIISIPTFLISLLIIPWLIGKLPHDFFLHHGKKSSREDDHSVFIAGLVFLARNVFGIIFLLAGIAMLFLPGQGILTIVIGLSLMTFPGKHRLMQKMISYPSVQHSLNWVRKKTYKTPFLWQNRE